MAGTALRRRLTWLVAEVVETIPETARVSTLVLDCPGWPGHRPGQHLDVRLTAEDGYQAQRSYSIAAPALGERLSITVEVVDGGEVSPYLAEEIREGDRLEVRGPIGGYFVWDPPGDEPLLLVAGGSGVVPLMAMVRARIEWGSSVPVRLLLSSRSWDDVIYRTELERISRDAPGIEVHHTLTRARPHGWDGYDRRVDTALLREVTWPPSQRPLCFVCGPTGFVESVAGSLVELGHPPERVKTERFGPSGGLP